MRGDVRRVGIEYRMLETEDISDTFFIANSRIRDYGEDDAEEDGGIKGLGFEGDEEDGEGIEIVIEIGSTVFWGVGTGIIWDCYFCYFDWSYFFMRDSKFVISRMSFRK